MYCILEVLVSTIVQILLYQMRIVLDLTGSLSIEGVAISARVTS